MYTYIRYILNYLEEFRAKATSFNNNTMASSMMCDPDNVSTIIKDINDNKN